MTGAMSGVIGNVAKKSADDKAKRKRDEIKASKPTVERFLLLFEGSQSHRGVWSVTGKDGDKVEDQARTDDKGGATVAHVNDHLSGECGLGVIPEYRVEGRTWCHFGFIDIDKLGDVTLPDLARKYADTPLVFTQSKSRGVAVWIFCRKRVESKAMREKLGEWSKKLERENKGLSVDVIRPHYEHLYRRGEVTDADGRFNGNPWKREDAVGHFVRLPYHDDPRISMIAYDNEGKPVPEWRAFVELAESKRLDGDDLPTVKRGRGRPQGAHTRTMMEKIEDGDIPEGERHAALMSALGEIKNIGLPEALQERLFQDLAGRLYPHPSDAEEREIRDIWKHGARFAEAEVGNLATEVTQLVKVIPEGTVVASLDKPTYVLTVRGKPVEVPSMAMLRNFEHTSTLIAEQIDFLPPREWNRRDRWRGHISQLMGEMLTTKVGISKSDEVREVMREFFEQYSHAEVKSDVMQGLVFHSNDGFSYFRFDAVVKKVELDGRHSRLPQNELRKVLETMGAQNTRGAKGVRMMCIPTDKIDAPTVIEGGEEQADPSVGEVGPKLIARPPTEYI